jgi:imidazolonepropionase-like amidohydrolase
LAGAPIENGTIIILGGKIAAVVPMFRSPRAEVIDAKGLQVYPACSIPTAGWG